MTTLNVRLVYSVNRFPFFPFSLFPLEHSSSFLLCYARRRLVGRHFAELLAGFGATGLPQWWHDRLGGRGS